MSENKVKPQVRDESKVRQVDGLARGGVKVGGKSVGIVSTYAVLPAASGVEDGLLAYDLAAGKLQITVSGAWVDVHA